MNYQNAIPTPTKSPNHDQILIRSSYTKCRILSFAKLNPREKLEIRPFAKLNPREISNFVIREIKSTRNLIHAKFNLREI